MSYTTDRLALPLPDGNDGPQGPDVPYWFERLGERLEAAVVSFDQGALAARPRQGYAGRVYFATDTGVIYYDDGRSWRTTTGAGTPQLVGNPGAPAFATGWANQLATQPVRFWKDGSRVHLAGTAAGTAPGNVFLLPDGFRPRYEHRFPYTPLNPSATYYYTYFGGMVRVGVDGWVSIAGYAILLSGGLAFDGLSFDLER
jgi:hypothetical protein